MSAIDIRATRRTIPDDARDGASQPAHAPDTWWYTLAHAETPLRERALKEDDLRALLELLRARGAPLPAELASPRARARRASDPLSGARFIWAFASLRDALQAARANRRSDYHAYPQPATLREASLDRLYRRFPLDEFPRTSVILFSGALVCPDPLLGADPAPGSLVAELADAITPALWERFTLCGFRQGASLVRVTPADRWVRMAPRALEDAWGAAVRDLRAPPPPGSAAPPPDPQAELDAMETAAFRALLGLLTGAANDEPPPSARGSRARMAIEV